MSKQLWEHLSKRRRKQFWLLLVLMVLASLTEVISIGAVLPFLGVITAPEQIYQHYYFQPLIEVLSIDTPSQIIFPITIIFILLVILSGIVRLTLLYVITRLSFAAGADLSIDIYRKTLYQKYAVHVSRNSSEIINGIISKTNTVIQGVINPILVLISSTILLVGITVILFAIDTFVALSASLSFGFLYWVVVYFTKQKLIENSECIAHESTQMIKSLQEGLGGIRDILIDGSQELYCESYQKADLPLRKAAGNNIFISGSPRYAMETLGICLIVGLAYTMVQQEGGAIAAIPILGALALGAQRLLPTLQQAYNAYSTIKGSYSSFNDVLKLLDQELPAHANKIRPNAIPFYDFIMLNDLSFRYNDKSSWVLKDVNLKINKGEKIGFIGVTGSGKSTLIDIIMGLLSPTHGNITIDNKVITSETSIYWQTHIAHVPQSIYLSDNTIEANIAFGVAKDQIDHKLVQQAAKQAQIEQLIEEWPEQYNTFVGERGIRLSGGQRQRIGIARALYKKADVLILDEATSALDNETERAVMEAIEGLKEDMTILIIAHRLTTLKTCDKVFDLSKNKEIDTVKALSYG